MKYQDILNKGVQILRSQNITSSNIDCELILSKVLGKTREEILINSNNKINHKQQKRFIFYLSKRKKKNIFGDINFILTNQPLFLGPSQSTS